MTGSRAGGTRALADGSGNFVPYDFYTDAGRTTLLAIDGTITLPTSTGVAQTVNLYGQARARRACRPGCTPTRWRSS
jgi:spore coat protein U-like protein